MGVEEARLGWGRTPSRGRPGLLKHSLTLIILINASTLHGSNHMTAVTQIVAEVIFVAQGRFLLYRTDNDYTAAAHELREMQAMCSSRSTSDRPST